jgi:hypothetical protein
VIYGGSISAGLWKSVDRGVSWSSVGTATTGLSSITTIAVGTSDPKLVYFSNANGIYKSTDGAITPMLVDPQPSVVLVFDPTNVSTLYSGQGSTRVRKTTNGGTSFDPAGTGITDNVTALAIDPTTPTRLYAGTASSGVFTTTNGGTMWTAASTGLATNDLAIGALAVESQDTSRVYAATLKTIYKSINHASSWVPFASGLSGNGWTLAHAPGDPNVLWAASTQGLFHSNNAAANWTQETDVLTTPIPPTFAIDPMNAKVVYLAQQGGFGVLKTVSGGF